MIKKKDPSQEDKKIWEEYIKNPSDIYDKDQGATNIIKRRDQYKFDQHGLTLDNENNKVKEILIKEGKNYFDTNTSSHHHFYDEVNNELTDIENSKIELKKFPSPPKGKSIKNVNVIINIDNDNQKH